MKHLHCRAFSPALALAILAPRLSWSEEETRASVQRGAAIARADGTTFTPYDLKRLQVCSCSAPKGGGGSQSVPKGVPVSAKGGPSQL